MLFAAVFVIKKTFEWISEEIKLKKNGFGSKLNFEGICMKKQRLLCCQENYFTRNLLEKYFFSSFYSKNIDK